MKIRDMQRIDHRLVISWRQKQVRGDDLQSTVLALLLCAVSSIRGAGVRSLLTIYGAYSWSISPDSEETLFSPAVNPHGTMVFPPLRGIFSSVVTRLAYFICTAAYDRSQLGEAYCNCSKWHVSWGFGV